MKKIPARDLTRPPVMVRLNLRVRAVPSHVLLVAGKTCCFYDLVPLTFRLSVRITFITMPCDE